MGVVPRTFFSLTLAALFLPWRHTRCPSFVQQWTLAAPRALYKVIQGNGEVEEGHSIYLYTCDTVQFKCLYIYIYTILHMYVMTHMYIYIEIYRLHYIQCGSNNSMLPMWEWEAYKYQYPCKNGDLGDGLLF